MSAEFFLNSTIFPALITNNPYSLNLDPITRDFTATTFVVEGDSTLLLWHNKVGAWLPPGGHIDPEELPEEAAVREVAEETGLLVELLGSRREWATVSVLVQPVCILLEDIKPGHQHIDLIYFARVVGGSAEVNPRESSKLRWCDHAELADPDILEDIRILGRRALCALDTSAIKS